MSEYAIYTGARIYHLMEDELHTKCGVNVFASNSDHYQSYGSPLKIVESIPEGLQLCPQCSHERSEKKGSKR
jgi:hypothetical protein